MKQESRDVKTSVSAALDEIAELIHKRSLIIIFSDMFESGSDEKKLADIFSALQHLKYNKHEVVVFNVLDFKHEVDFEFGNMPYHFVDMETGEEMKLHPHQMKEKYQESIGSFRKELKLKCAQYGIDLIDADINAGFYNILHTYLLKRSKMF